MEDRGVMFHEGIPDHQALVQWFPQGQGVMALDDLMDKGSHHQNVTVIYLCQDMFPVGKLPKAFPAMLITSWPSRTRGINWGYPMSCFNSFLPPRKTVWKAFIMPPHVLIGIWCWICTWLHPTNNDC